ncbi:DUF222 domain-containing protein [Sinomonas halotolerans]|uniref:DUF222 domain-containing protein n=1 Tax=Sinomonas halotolerans TaxID=1644133 RepID=A0ABU9WX80_9MICC
MALRGALWVDPAVLTAPHGAARTLKALADFDAYSAALRAFLVNLLAQQIAEEPLNGRDGQPLRLDGDLAHAATVSEVALVAGTSEAAAARAVNFSDSLVNTHPAVHEALLAGDISEAHAKVIVDQASTLPPEAAELLGMEALGRLRTRKGHLRTPGELRIAVKGMRERRHPESITERRAKATADRGVWLRPEDDGMCTLTALLPAEIGIAAYKRVDAIARAARGADGEYRTTPQLRADALAQALLAHGARPGTGPSGGSRPPQPARAADQTPAAPATADQTPAAAAPANQTPAAAAPTDQTPAAAAPTDQTPAAAAPADQTPAAAAPAEALPEPVALPEALDDLVRAEVVVHIPAAVLLGASDDVAELEGYGVVDAHTARGLAAAAPTWQRLWTDAEGVPVRLGRTVYRPPESLRRFIRYRDGACRVPGCTRAARRSEIDHIVEWQDGGPTDADNLALLCPKHHALKSLALFTLRRTPAEGGRRLGADVVWTTLLGFEHPAEPLDRDHILGGPAGAATALEPEPEPPPLPEGPPFRAPSRPSEAPPF